MDRYAEKADSYSQQQEYYECLAACPNDKDCGCGGASGMDNPRVWFAFVLTILLVIMLCVIAYLIETHKENKTFKNWKEKNKKKEIDKKKY